MGEWTSLDTWDDSMTATVEVCPDEPMLPPLDYEEWISRGKALAAETNNRSWLLGDWLIEGEDSEYNMQNTGIPSYLLIGSHPPNFWKTVSDQVDLAVGTLKNYAYVARRYRDGRRFSELSWSHHLMASPYERRYEYLAACIVPGAKPHTLDWLETYIDQNEEDAEVTERRSIPLRLPLSMVQKLKQVAHFRGKSVEKLAYDQCAIVLTSFLRQAERDIALEKYGMYDEGAPWPLSPEAEQHYRKYQRKAKRRALTQRTAA
jgi:hypothetical protein